MTEQHTPGPWATLLVERNRRTKVSDWIVTGEAGAGRHVATAKHEGDARLIAAAPETAAERDRLKAVLESIANNRLSIDVPPEEKPDHDYAQGWDALVTAARAAIAKAKEA